MSATVCTDRYASACSPKFVTARTVYIASALIAHAQDITKLIIVLKRGCARRCSDTRIYMILIWNNTKTVKWHWTPGEKSRRRLGEMKKPAVKYGNICETGMWRCMLLLLRLPDCYSGWQTTLLCITTTNWNGVWIGNISCSTNGRTCSQPKKSLHLSVNAESMLLRVINQIMT